jgi:hypothetical protein
LRRKDQQKMPQIPASSMESLRQVTKILAEQKRKRNEFLKDGVRTVPVKDEVLEKLVWVVGGDEDEIMSRHPGYDLDGKIKSLQRALETYWRCHADLITRLDAFDVASKDGTLFNRSRAAELREHEAACRKEIFAAVERCSDSCRSGSPCEKDYSGIRRGAREKL